MSRISGVDSSNRSCSYSSDCELTEVCGKRRGMTTGRCHARSSSLQDAWALAAVEVEEPKCAVEKNGVTFHPQDIKALVTQLYFQSDRLSDARSRGFARFSSALMPGQTGLEHLDTSLEGTANCSAIRPSADFFTMLTHVVGRLKQPLLVRFGEPDGAFPIVGYRVQEFKRLPNDTIDGYHYASVRVELDVVGPSLEEDDRVSVLQAQLAFTARAVFRNQRKGFILVTTNSLLSPLSLEYPLPRRLNEDPNSKLSISNVMDLVTVSLNCARPRPVESPVCNPVPYTLELRRLRQQVELCEATLQLSFNSLRESDLGRACFQWDCHDVFNALRRINYRGCRLPNGLQISHLIDSFFSLCAGVEALPPLDYNITRPTPVPTNGDETDPPRTRVPPATSPAKTKHPSTRRPHEGSSDDGILMNEDGETKNGVPDPTSPGDLNPVAEVSSRPADLQSFPPTGARPRPSEASERSTKTPSLDENRSTASQSILFSKSNSTESKQHHQSSKKAAMESPTPTTASPLEPALVTTSVESTSAVLTLLGLIGGFVLVGEVVLLLSRLYPSSSNHKQRRSRPHPLQTRTAIDTLTGSSQFAGVSLWDEELLLDRFIPASTITNVRLLGGGACGVVYLVRLNDRQLAASKRLATHHVNDPAAQQQLIDEIKLNASLQHPNIVALIGASWTTRANLQAVFEYLSGGDLLSYLESNRTPERMVWTRAKLQLAMDVAYALAYIHSLLPSPVVHRDLKSRNILLSSTSSSTSEITAKLCDFGVSRTQSSQQSMTTGVGTSRWLAPEVILGGGAYDAACDVYSFGVVLTELDTHEVPFHDVRGPEGTMLPDVAVLRMVAQEGLRPGVSAACPEALATLARECMAQDASQRPTASELCKRLTAIQAVVGL
ncbi:hypothetical protein PINS_up007771 [Pythium insidiosum]|nr:hypothetical protein PINS_up007771 [Pythium insidiosum]